MRLFIAASPSEEQTKELSLLQERLDRSLEGIRWARPEALHLTLKFLGELEEHLLESIAQSMKSAARSIKPFNFSFKGIGVFPSPRRARVIWSGVAEGAEELKRLAQALDDQLAAKGFPAEKRPFKAHLTLGRMRRSVPEKTLLTLLSNKSSFFTGTTRMEHFSLYRSRLLPEGAHYTSLNKIFFGPDRGK